MRSTIAIIAVLCLSGIAEAGPIRDRIKARFGGSCQPCNGCSVAPARAVPEYLPEPSVIQPASHALPAPVYAPLNYGGGCPGGVCPGGVCPAPTATRVRLFGR